MGDLQSDGRRNGRPKADFKATRDPGWSAVHTGKLPDLCAGASHSLGALPGLRTVAGVRSENSNWETDSPNLEWEKSASAGDELRSSTFRWKGLSVGPEALHS